MPIALAVHGGAWNIPDDAVDASREGVRLALQAGWAVLTAGGTSLDAVETAVRLLEDDPNFDAGRGSRLNAAREVEMDAAIMDGRRLDVGAVGAIRQVRHPIHAARIVLERSPHVLLVGEGARSFALDHGIEVCSTEELLVGRELDRYLRVEGGESQLVDLEFDPDGHGGAGGKGGPLGTVGAVAVDRQGNVAAATSTGGTQNKAAGRIGDSPIPGAGTFADNHRGGASATGWGEGILRVLSTKTAVDRMGQGDSPAAAGRFALDDLARVGGKAGLILVNPAGEVAAVFNTPRMARGLAREHGGVRVGVEPGEVP